MFLGFKNSDQFSTEVSNKIAIDLNESEVCPRTQQSVRIILRLTLQED